MGSFIVVLGRFLERGLEEVEQIETIKKSRNDGLSFRKHFRKMCHYIVGKTKDDGCS